jgi:hypothetical protein
VGFGVLWTLQQKRGTCSGSSCTRNMFWPLVPCSSCWVRCTQRAMVCLACYKYFALFCCCGCAPNMAAACTLGPNGALLTFPLGASVQAVHSCLRSDGGPVGCCCPGTPFVCAAVSAGVSTWSTAAATACANLFAICWLQQLLVATGPTVMGGMGARHSPVYR